jgi:hypothetical protein
MRWKDGWQEVLGIDGESADLLRYYVIERIEDRGRLSVETGVDYPELVVIERTPRDLVSALIVTAGGAAPGGSGDGAGGEVKSYSLDESVERWEGIFEAGGKREYVKFDKTSDKYPHAVDTDPATLSSLLDALRNGLQKAGLEPAALLAMSEAERVAAYRVLASDTGIRGCARQEDVYGFVEAMITRLGGAG